MWIAIIFVLKVATKARNILRGQPLEIVVKNGISRRRRIRRHRGTRGQGEVLPTRRSARRWHCQGTGVSAEDTLPLEIVWIVISAIPAGAGPGGRAEGNQLLLGRPELRILLDWPEADAGQVE